MHKRFISNIVSRNILIVSFLMLIPLGWAFYDDPHSLEVLAFIQTISIGTILSVICIGLFRVRKKDYSRLNAKDGLAIVGLSWICLSALGALPLFLTGVVDSYTDAFFETTSGFTTTGATVLANVEAVPRGLLFWRSLTHWLGGMGLIVLYIALLPAIGTNAYQLYKAEAPGLTVERVEPRLKETAKYLWTIYFLLSFLETVFLMGGGMSFFDALCHTFGTMATGGFSTRNASIGAFNPYIQWVITVFMFLAGTNFILHYLAFRFKPNPYFRDEEFRSYFLLMAIAVGGFAFILWQTQASLSPVRTSAFQVIAIATTTGFTVADFSLWPAALQFVLVLLMFIGGCGGSTGGGMKVVRVLLSVKNTFRAVVQAVYPNAILPLKFNKKPLSDRLITAMLTYVVIFLHLFFLGTVLFILLERCDIVTAITASIAALSNIGPGLGLVGPSGNYAWVSIPGKWLLIFLMLAGRLELYSILILFVPSTWKK